MVSSIWPSAMICWAANLGNIYGMEPSIEAKVLVSPPVLRASADVALEGPHLREPEGERYFVNRYSLRGSGSSQGEASRSRESLNLRAPHLNAEDGFYSSILGPISASLPSWRPKWELRSIASGRSLQPAAAEAEHQAQRFSMKAKSWSIPRPLEIKTGRSCSIVPSAIITACPPFWPTSLPMAFTGIAAADGCQAWQSSRVRGSKSSHGRRRQ